MTKLEELKAKRRLAIEEDLRDVLVDAALKGESLDDRAEELLPLAEVLDRSEQEIQVLFDRANEYLKFQRMTTPEEFDAAEAAAMKAGEENTKWNGPDGLRDQKMAEIKKEARQVEGRYNVAASRLQRLHDLHNTMSGMRRKFPLLFERIDEPERRPVRKRDALGRFDPPPSVDAPPPATVEQAEFAKAEADAARLERAADVAEAGGDILKETQP